MKFSLLITPIVATNFEDIVARVNSLQMSWTARVPKFESLGAVKQLLATDMGEHERLASSLPESETPRIDIPDDFDVRSNWPSCSIVTGDIRDQSACGSCWAHGAVESFNDRYCIATGSTALLSTEDALANSGAGSCDGGQPISVLNWIEKTGIVSGGDYTDIGKGTTCAPYSLPTCQHHNWKPPTPEHPACPDKGYPTPKPFSSCKENGYSTSFEHDKVQGSPPYSIKGESNIQSEIAQYGSVSAVFWVYDDLPAYESGVYQRSPGASFLGGHAVAIIGWGTQDGTPYWLIKNSWNTDWGDKGLFKMRRGNNECGIEGSIVASKAVAEPALRLPPATWKSGSGRFSELSREELQSMMGTRVQRNPAFNHSAAPPVPRFDAREAWPACPSISKIADQGACGSCFGVATVTAFNDRECVASNGTMTKLLSSQDLVSCDHLCNAIGCDSGCGGGFPGTAWKYLTQTGVPTEDCVPYALPPCHHPCGATSPTPACSATCADGTAKVMHKAATSYPFFHAEDLFTDLLRHGSIVCGMSVYEDFPTYKSGVYRHTSGSMLGGHAVRLIGWGEDNGETYWLVANSWNSDFGESGTFRIARGGEDGCGFEEDCWAGHSKGSFENGVTASASITV